MTRAIKASIVHPEVPIKQLFMTTNLTHSHSLPLSVLDRFRADDMLQDAREDCYLSTLHIHHTDEHDSRPYYLVVENERGTDRHAIHLIVEGTFAGA